MQLVHVINTICSNFALFWCRTYALRPTNSILRSKKTFLNKRSESKLQFHQRIILFVSNCKKVKQISSKKYEGTSFLHHSTILYPIWDCGKHWSSLAFSLSLSHTHTHIQTDSTQRWARENRISQKSKNDLILKRGKTREKNKAVSQAPANRKASGSKHHLSLMKMFFGKSF